MNVRVVGAGEAAETLRAALARVGLAERAGEPAAFVCTVDDLSRAIAMRELAQVTGPIVVLTDDAASAIEAGADDAGGTADEVARRVSARIRAPKVSRLEETPMAEPPAASGRRQKPLILVVEDDEDARMVLTELLRPRYDVDAVGDGETALKRAAELNPDLVLLDLFLPGMDGFGALTGLRRNSKTADTPVIFLSAQGDAETKSQGLSLGAADYLAKPFSEQELMARVDRTLKLTAQKEHFRALAQTDGLTGLPNFRSFHARLEEEVSRAHRYGHPLACAMVDLDGLKEINDKLGHAAGNRAIVALADAVREELRDTDFAARYGGDEFVVLLPQTNETQGAQFAERLRRRLVEVSQDAGLPVRGSIGVAAVNAGELDSADAAEDLLRRADEALYRAKRSGRDRVEVAQVPH
ncbi:MAG: diguanylate cyclase [Deltaproteobacteria bacterium]|nr:MAG: diguanylate cyclase [Deltaproteobacteria bacterium]TMB41162.1 MAG: diguanylate cyclase [Deltaproteobacteria bacterium]